MTQGVNYVSLMDLIGEPKNTIYVHVKYINPYPERHVTKRYIINRNEELVKNREKKLIFLDRNE